MIMQRLIDMAGNNKKLCQSFKQSDKDVLL